MPAEQQRKQITVLFADVSGFTAMSETLDAEDVTEVMNALWQRLDADLKATDIGEDTRRIPMRLTAWRAAGCV